MAEIRYFLGANTPNGFYSLYDDWIDRSMIQSVYILKGGPGCGKSSLMRRVAQHAAVAGHSVEYIHCSGDPDSLDGIFLPEQRTALVDGTAPHVVEPSCPGVVDHYMDLGRCYDTDGLQAGKESILARMAENKSAYRRCYRCLAAVGTLDSDVRDLLLTPELRLALQKRARGIAARELKHGGAQCGRVDRRFLSAVTCRGRVTLWDTVAAQCKRVYALCDEYGLAHELLLPLCHAAAAQGYDVVACPSPLCPERLAHLLIPALELAFVTSSKAEPYPERPYRRLHLDAMLTRDDSYPLNRSRVRFSLRIRSALLTEGIQALEEAKQAHDSLEALYNPYVDFSAVYEEGDALARTLFPEGLTAGSK